jgi:hypothetical protein
MSGFTQIHTSFRKSIVRIRLTEPRLLLVTLLVLIPMAARAQGSPFDTDFNAIDAPQTQAAAARGQPNGMVALCVALLPMASKRHPWIDPQKCNVSL